MKNILKIGMVILITSLLWISCDPQEDDKIDIGMPPAEEDLSFTVTEGANNYFTFVNTSSLAGIARWDFDNGEKGSGDSDSTQFRKKGDYNITLSLAAKGGVGSITKTVSVASDIIIPNLIENGEFNDDQLWTIMPLSDGVNVSFTDGKAVWTGGGWGQVGIYQEIQVEANKMYQIDMDISGSGSSETWFEVYLGMAVPVSGSDYSDGGTLLGLNTWDGCGTAEFASKFTAVSCSGDAVGAVEFSTSGSAFLVIRGGGGNLGTISIDNVEVSPVE